MSSRSSVDRAPARCSGGHGFDSCRGLRIFLCPTLVSCWLIHLYIDNLLSCQLIVSFVHTKMIPVYMPECRLRFSYIILHSAEFVSPTQNISYTIAFILSPLYCFFTYLVLECLEAVSKVVNFINFGSWSLYLWENFSKTSNVKIVYPLYLTIKNLKSFVKLWTYLWRQ